MISLEEARQTILSKTPKMGVERIHLLEATGRILAEDVLAPWNLPLQDNSAMDGYAVRADDCNRIPCRLKVSGYIPAGETADGICVESGSAIRIMTGAPTPDGCDAVVPVEESDNGDEYVMLNEKVSRGQHIRICGEDVSKGVIFLRAGTVIRPPEISMLASFGMAIVAVYRKPVVAILSTGDELIELGTTPQSGEIINSNTLTLASAVKEAGAIPLIIGIARDTRKSHLEKLSEGLKADMLITSAGVSAGDRDLVRETLDELGVQQVFWKIAVKPGGPTAFALHGTTPVFSLPGNPVSTIITFEELVRPALLRMQGREQVIQPLFKAVLRDGIKKKPGKIQIVRVRLERDNGRWYAVSSGNQQTAILKTMLDAQALAILPVDAVSFSAGEEVDVHFYGNYVELLS